MGFCDFDVEQHEQRVAEIRREQGDAAAARYQKESFASGIGGAVGLGGGAMSGAVIGSLILPGLGTFLGGVIGGVAGLVAGVHDKSPTDNLKTAGKAIGSFHRFFK